MSADPFLDGALRQLVRLAIRHPQTIEARRARSLARHVRYYRAHGLLLPLTRRRTLADLRSATKALQQLDIERNDHA